MPLTWLKVLKYVLPVIAILLGIWAWDHHVAQQATATLRAQVAEQDAKRAKLVAQQQTEVAQSEADMRSNKAAREALAAELAARIDAYNGVAARLRIATDRANANPVPAGGAGSGPAVPSAAGDCGAGRIDAAVQRVIDEGRSCGIALAALSAKPLCECPPH